MKKFTGLQDLLVAAVERCGECNDGSGDVDPKVCRALLAVAKALGGINEMLGALLAYSPAYEND